MCADSGAGHCGNLHLIDHAGQQTLQRGGQDVPVDRLVYMVTSLGIVRQAPDLKIESQLKRDWSVEVKRFTLVRWCGLI